MPCREGGKNGLGIIFPFFPKARCTEVYWPDVRCVSECVSVSVWVQGEAVWVQIMRPYARRIEKEIKRPYEVRIAQKVFIFAIVKSTRNQRASYGTFPRSGSLYLKLRPYWDFSNPVNGKMDPDCLNLIQ